MPDNHLFANWVKETTTTSGTGDVTLSAISGFTEFSDEFVSGDLVYYSLLDGANRETGIGTVGASGNSLARTTPQATLVAGVYDDNSPSAITLSGGTTYVYVTMSKSSLDEGHFIFNKGTSTGILSGGVLSIDADNTKFDISAGSGIILDNYTDPNHPTGVLVEWDAFNAQTVTGLLTQPRSFIAINSSGSIVQSTTAFTNTESRDYIIIGTLGHANLTNIVATIQTQQSAHDATARLADLAHAIGALNVSGNVYSPTGGAKLIAKNAGTTYRLGVNFENDPKNPDLVSDGVEAGSSFHYSYRDGSGGYNLSTVATAVVSNLYDDGSGTLQAVTTNQWTIQIVKFFTGVAGSPKTRIEYGQQTFNSKLAALDNLPDSTHAENPAFFDGVIRCYLVSRGGASDLGDTGDAVFIEAAKFGASGGGQFTAMATDLQQAYDNSISPEILTDGTRGALSVKEGTGIGGNLYEGYDDSATLVFKVDVAGNLTANNVPFNKLDATTAPGVTNDGTEGYAPGSDWIDVTNDKAYKCLDSTTGAAVWIESTQSGGGGGSPFTDLEFSLNLSKTTATLNGTATDGHVNLGSGTSITGTAAQAYDFATISGGQTNSATRAHTTVGGGQSNSATNAHATVGGGTGNVAAGIKDTVGGGASNSVTAGHGTIGGGKTNVNTSAYGVIAGGYLNTISTSSYCVIGGGYYNIASGLSSVVAGGGGGSTFGNEATGDYSAITGGYNNVAAGLDSFVGGGKNNAAAGGYCVVSGGEDNTMSGHGHQVIGGGTDNYTANHWATVSGGANNSAISLHSTIVGGYGGDATAIQSTVLGGKGNKAAHVSSLAGGGASQTNADYDLVLGATDSLTAATANNTIRLGAGNGSGNIDAEGTITASSTADYAEMFEWFDGNPTEEDRVGYFVSLHKGKIVKGAGREDKSGVANYLASVFTSPNSATTVPMLGIMSADPAILGDAGSMSWTGRTLKDNVGRKKKLVYKHYTWVEEIEITTTRQEEDEEGNVVDIETTEVEKTPKSAFVSISNNKQYKEYPQYSHKGILSTEIIPENATYVTIKFNDVSPSFDPTLVYIPRAERKEWDPVGMLGKLYVHTAEPITSDWVQSSQDGRALNAPNGVGYQVLEVIDNTLVRVLFK